MIEEHRRVRHTDILLLLTAPNVNRSACHEKIYAVRFPISFCEAIKCDDSHGIDERLDAVIVVV